MSGLSPEQRALRELKATASFLPYLMANNMPIISERWMDCVGHPDYVEPDLSKVWPVYLGTHGESIALNFYESKHGHALTRRGEVVNHRNLDYFCCTLDCHREYDDTDIDVKWIGGYRKLDEICAFYTPQMIGQTGCTGSKNASLLIVHGGAEPVEYPITWTPEYEAAVWERVAWFWQCVLDLTPPYEMPEIAAPVIAAVEYDMSESNVWAEGAFLWMHNRGPHQTYLQAEKELKGMVPADAKRAYGHGIAVTRAKNGALTVREEKP